MKLSLQKYRKLQLLTFNEITSDFLECFYFTFFSNMIVSVR